MCVSMNTGDLPALYTIKAQKQGLTCRGTNTEHSGLHFFFIGLSIDFQTNFLNIY